MDKKTKRLTHRVMDAVLRRLARLNGWTTQDKVDYSNRRTPRPVNYHVTRFVGSGRHWALWRYAPDTHAVNIMPKEMHYMSAQEMRAYLLGRIAEAEYRQSRKEE